MDSDQWVADKQLSLAKALGGQLKAQGHFFGHLSRKKTTQEEEVRRAKVYMGTSLITNSALLGPYSRTMTRPYSGPRGGGRFLLCEVPLYADRVFVGSGGVGEVH